MKTITIGRRSLKFGLAVALLATQFLHCNEADAQTKKYPYVMEGNIIVCREGNNGLKQILIHGNWSETPSHNEYMVRHNNFPAKFQWKISDNSDQDLTKNDVTRYCRRDGWRLPTVKETLLVMTMGLRSNTPPFHNRDTWATYLSSTIVSGSTDDAALYRWGVTLGSNALTIAKTKWSTSTEAICVRDL